jgi:hypothetical protein
MGRILLALLLLGAAPAMAQPQTIVVPAGPGVAIPPRGQAMPRPSMAPATRAQRRAAMPAAEQDTLNAPATAAIIGLAGAAALAAMLGGGGGGSGGGGAASAAPSRTR